MSASDGLMLYAVKFRSSIVKIGVTENPCARFRALRQKFGKIESSFLSDCSVTGRAAEVQALERAGKMASYAVGNESFLGLKFGDARHIVRQSANRHKAENMVRGVIAPKGLTVTKKKGAICVKVGRAYGVIDAAKLERWALRILREEAFSDEDTWDAQP